MRKLWLGILLILTVCAILTACALAEGLEIEDESPVIAETIEQPVPEAEEFVIGEEQAVDAIPASEQPVPEAEEYVIEGEQAVDAIPKSTSYPSVFFFSDAEFENLIIKDTAILGMSYPIRMYWFAAYNNEGYDLAIYDNSGNVVATDSNTWTNGGYTKKITVYWDTSGCKSGTYKVVVTKKFYSYFKWNEAPTTETLLINLQCDHHSTVTVKGKAATYTSTGLTDGVKCSICGEWITPQKEIARKVYPGSTLKKKGKNSTITAYIGTPFFLTPQFATNAKVAVKTYKSSKPKFATVTADGLVTPKKAGTTTITVTTANKKVKATIKVKVVAPPPESISITNKGPITLKPGKTVALKTSLTPAYAASTLTWTSSDKSIATVNKKGKVKASKKKTGTVTITATSTKDKKVKATITINVN